MLDNVKIILTTRGRVENQHTLRNLQINNLLTIVCYKGERERLLELYEEKVTDIIEYPEWCSNIDLVRFWCITEFDNDYIIFIDDNLSFSARIKAEKGEGSKFPLHVLNIKNFNVETIAKIQLDMFQLIIEKLKSDKYGIVGISQRSGNNNHEEDFEENFRVYAFWGINKKLFLPYIEEYNIQNYTFKGDLYTFIFLLSKGIKNLCIYKYAFDKVGGANSKGGCSIYRTKEVIIKEALQLKEDFPEFVKVKEKNSKSWNNLEDKIIDVNIFWKKAYEYGIKKKRI